MKPFVSIILPVFNAQYSLKAAIDSIIHQTYTDWELIIVDDGSTDNSIKIIQSINNERVIYYKTENRGIAKALNFGIKMSNTNIICRMDADDICHQERLEMQFNYLQEHPEVGVVSSLVEFNGNREANAGYALFVDEINQIIGRQSILKKRFTESPIAHPSVMFRKSLVHKYGGYNEGDLPEDYELWLRWMHNDVVFEKVNSPLLHWHDSAARLSRTHANYDLEKFYALKIKYLALYFVKQQIPSDNLWVWGTGRQINKWIALLKRYGLDVKGQIDVKTTYLDGSVIHFTELAKEKHPLIISLVRDRNGKKRIEAYLKEQGYNEGKDFFMLS
ncbi:glycosyltransferase [Fulvivirga lutimaris]|uniref:glycosyltransferase n=1 Tax=Fulvivirga lutimaris TaxID=1819566 RepID=UPI0012BB4ECC|nr:glycosyltransferase [Fulvivirga lutimaris]MTI40621.1 glycosyltransferase [Fulvivirga lutimaris]